MNIYQLKQHPEYIDVVKTYCQNKIDICQNHYMWEQQYYWEKVLENIHEDNVYVCYRNNKNDIITIATTYKRFDKTIWDVPKYAVEFARKMKQDNQEFFLRSTDYRLATNADMKSILCTSSDNTNTIYPVLANSELWASSEEIAASPRNWLESRFLNPSDNWQNKVQFIWLNRREFQDWIYDKALQDFPWQRDTYGHSAIIGFHYLNLEHTTERTRYLIAHVDNKPIGAICIGDYPDYGYYAVQYIDVAMPYRGNGVAKKLIHALAKTIPDDRPLVLSQESEMGKKCHVHECFKREIWPNELKTNTY